MNSETFSLFVSSGFTFPVKEFYLEDVLEITGFKFTPKRSNLGPQKPHWHKFTKRGKEERVEGKGYRCSDRKKGKEEDGKGIDKERERRELGEGE